LTRVYPSFGRMSYWHNVEGAPRGTIKERSEALLQIWRDGTACSHWRGPMKPVQLRAMALELAVACGQQSLEMPNNLTALLAELLQLPPEFLSDPTALYVRADDGKGQKTPPGAYEVAMWIDRSEIQETGKQPSARKLAKLLAERGMPVDEKTLREWRKTEDYSAWIAFIEEKSISENEGK
jgi:hypothetical protein